MPKHIYVVDTCVLLHDPQALHKFADNDIYLPLAVIDDLDEIKTRPASVGWSAREVFRLLDTYNVVDMMNKGAVANEQGGKIFVYNTEAPLKSSEAPNIVRVNSDNAIINACLALKTKFPRRKVSIVTKDTGLRVRAHSWGCEAENYRSDLLPDDMYTGMRHVNIDSKSDWDVLWTNIDVLPDMLSEEVQAQLQNLSVNEFVLFDWGTNTCPSRYMNTGLRILKDKNAAAGKDKISYMGVTHKNLEQRCALEILADDTISMVSLCGPAGTGKTMLSIAVALEKVKQGIYDRIIVIKPLIPVGGRDIGALPGDKFDKISAWLGPIRDNIQQLVGERNENGVKRQSSASFEELVQAGTIEVEAMAFIQGRSIPNSVVIVDECENISPREARMVVERCGKNSKIILLGDLSQVENPYLDARSNGLAHALNGSRHKAVCGVVTLSKVERSSLAAIASDIFHSPEARSR